MKVKIQNVTKIETSMLFNLKQNLEEPVALIGHGGFCEELAPSRRKG